MLHVIQKMFLRWGAVVAGLIWSPASLLEFSGISAGFHEALVALRRFASFPQHVLSPNVIDFNGGLLPGGDASSAMRSSPSMFPSVPFRLRKIVTRA